VILLSALTLSADAHEEAAISRRARSFLQTVVPGFLGL
jgi:hypothetical protein